MPLHVLHKVVPLGKLPGDDQFASSTEPAAPQTWDPFSYATPLTKYVGALHTAFVGYALVDQFETTKPVPVTAMQTFPEQVLALRGRIVMGVVDAFWINVFELANAGCWSRASGLIAPIPMATIKIGARRTRGWVCIE